MVPGFSVNYVYRTLYNVTTEHNTPDSFLNFIILISVRIFCIMVFYYESPESCLKKAFCKMCAFDYQAQKEKRNQL